MFGKSDDLKDMRKWRVWKLKLIDARLYFVSIFVGLLTGLVAVPYHYLLQLFFNTRRDFLIRIHIGIGIFLFSCPYGEYFCLLCGW